MLGVPSVAMGCLETGHADNRRVICEYLSPRGDISIQKFNILSSGGLGNHYHTRTNLELFEITEGGGILCVADWATGDESGVSPVRVYELMPGIIVEIRPMMVHTFFFYAGSGMHCTSLPARDLDDMTTCVLAKLNEASRQVELLAPLAEAADQAKIDAFNANLAAASGKS